MMFLRKFIIVAGVFLAVASCQPIPQEALDNYVLAFGEVRTVGEALANDFAAAKAESERRDKARKSAEPAPPQPEIPLSYTPPATGTKPPTATEVRLLAWNVIGKYNEALAALAAGKSVETVKTAMESLGTAAGKIASAAGETVPEVASVVTIAKEIAALAEKARLAGEFRKALKTGVPKVRKMLEIMVADTKSHYQLRASLANQDLLDLSSSDAVKEERIKAAVSEFRQSLDQFVILAQKCDQSLVDMMKADEKSPNFVSSANELFVVALAVKSHWAAYQAARIEGAN